MCCGIVLAGRTILSLPKRPNFERGRNLLRIAAIICPRTQSPPFAGSSDVFQLRASASFSVSGSCMPHRLAYHERGDLGQSRVLMARHGANRAPGATSLPYSARCPATTA